MNLIRQNHDYELFTLINEYINAIVHDQFKMFEINR